MFNSMLLIIKVRFRFFDLFAVLINTDKNISTGTMRIQLNNTFQFTFYVYIMGINEMAYRVCWL